MNLEYEMEEQVLNIARDLSESEADFWLSELCDICETFGVLCVSREAVKVLLCLNGFEELENVESDTLMWYRKN